VHPISTALFLLGYGLALPIGARLQAVVAGRHRLAMWGHQLGILIAALGWALRGGLAMAALHLAWLALAGVWFGFAPRLPRRGDRG
jgi:hypothetical protein